MFQRVAGFVVLISLIVGCAKEQKTASAAPATPEELLAKVDQQFLARDYTGATASLEQLLEIEPKNRITLLLAGRATLNQATILAGRGERQAARDWYLKSAAYMKELRSAYPQLNEAEAALLQRALYNEGRAEALAGHTDKALAALTDAVHSGYDDLEEMGRESDLKSLRDLPAFQKLLQDKSAKMSHEAREHAKLLLAENKPFPFDFSLPSVDGKPLAKKDFAGKVLIVDFWGTWCRPCLMEIPHFEDLLKNHRDAGLAIVGLNYNEQDGKEPPAARVQNFVREHHITYPCALGDDKTLAQVPNLKGFPTTLFLDRSGTVRLVLEGYHPLAELSGIVSVLLEEKPSAAAK